MSLFSAISCKVFPRNLIAFTGTLRVTQTLPLKTENFPISRLSLTKSYRYRESKIHESKRSILIS